MIYEENSKVKSQESKTVSIRRVYFLIFTFEFLI